MANPFFEFKKFTIFHDKCAMKVGTDGVLLGAWSQTENCEKILDIGTGSGLIALMLAQRSDENVIIDAIDIDQDAICQAKENVNNSPFSNIRCSHKSLQEYFGKSKIKYDLIVSNPPYFRSSLHPLSDKRTLARHTDSLCLEDFIRMSSQLLSNKGKISLIFPYLEKDYIINLANEASLFLTRMTTVYPKPTSVAKRILLEFSVNNDILDESELVIEVDRHQYSSDFVNLVKDFYLKL